MFYHVSLNAVLLLVFCIDSLFKPGLMAAITALSPDTNNLHLFL